MSQNEDILMSGYVMNFSLSLCIFFLFFFFFFTHHKHDISIAKYYCLIVVEVVMSRVWPILMQLIYFCQQSGSSENLPGGANFIPQDRFTYLTLAIISSTLMLGILFPQSKCMIALSTKMLFWDWEQQQHFLSWLKGI